MEIFINLDIDPELPARLNYHLDNHRFVAYLESLGKAMDCAPETTVSVTFCDNQTIHRLNLEYREKDMPTDVLSFPQGMENNLLGDLVISLEKANEQAQEVGNSLDRELAFLVTHGFLHLMGYDHQEPEEEEIMFKLQRELLEAHFPECFKQANVG
ncbi:rRNA maturation RNase YbeY [bacterium (Candidatus Blackallbacteria) CG17_big_fil_post_rev_8_21_14_2_50_48_46]|uniref:Endoribonuclease YbeY n=1 Tax=bacterium (Candidatus Blackallbacteria) CG17_big_fil_post_rev_8_21_14_2_50_48_46 TaxID=2014261 RepID=A0A2M7G6D3_9BACT|nr:MAG: rRNA maturation RNase YbeY [bacterium (Candidatus Blackallbacteria) CG18_big_fil_WC_8_21_14_2_50_49_26]PIW17555.1 MAG: rRNA maturation RNase YbeY [bacterium (Candidatus Blackallbacteria) CG17_big_fil_post_rev_8_21_14_2_50_48_46]PIW48410.1 MAG: rRNA maturation RNase YbeY [bacterium (Candidatus Blackallbacteria) CG13_big_fil_rev_8_21_14_2_50_49_14]